MAIGKIQIIGQIGSFDGIKGVELVDVIVQYQNVAKTNPERILVEIDSPGGICDVGHDIFIFLSTQKIPVDTHVIGMCASIATLPMLAGENRYAVPQAEILVHNPWINGVSGDFDTLTEAAEYIRIEEDKLIDIYSKVVGLSKEAIDALLKQDQFMTPEQALSIGFITEIKNSEITYAKLKNQKIMAKLDDKTKINDGILKRLDEIGTFLKNAFKDKAKGMMVKDDQGRTLELWNSDQTEATEIKQGVMVTMDGTPAPDGVYNLPDQKVSIQVAGGSVTAVNPISEDATKEENKALKEEIETLKAENKKLQDAYAKTESEILAVKQMIASNHEPDTKDADGKIRGKSVDQEKAYDMDRFRKLRGIK